MELYVLGPAFGLASIDAECIAAAAVLRLRLTTGWRIIPTYDQTKRLPHLRDGDRHINGFKNIDGHVERLDSNDKFTSDGNEHANAIAISSFIESKAQTLLDISLYVSFENYSATRTAFTKILPWYANYMVPPKRREAARKRTEHLGISSVDIDDVHEDLSNRPAGFDVGKEKKFESETQKRASLLLPQKNTVRSLLQRPEHSAVFKLHALADNFFEPLQDMLGDSEFFLGAKEPQEIDCLAYGYLSLMLYPQLAQDWLAKTMRKKYRKLVQYTERMHERLGMQTSAEDVMTLSECESKEEVRGKRNACNMTLPWEPPAPAGIADIASKVACDLFSRIPFVGPGVELVPAMPSRQNLLQTHFPAALVATAATLGLCGYYAFATGLLIWPRGEEVHIFGRRRLADYGHLGAALAGISIIGQQGSQNVMYDQQKPDDGPLQVQVGVEKDTVP